MIKNKWKFIGLSILFGGLFVIGFILGVRREKNNNLGSNTDTNATGVGSTEESLRDTEQLRELNKQHKKRSEQLRRDSANRVERIRRECDEAIGYIDQLREFYRKNPS